MGNLVQRGYIHTHLISSLLTRQKKSNKNYIIETQSNSGKEYYLPLMVGKNRMMWNNSFSLPYQVFQSIHPKVQELFVNINRN